MKKITSDTSIEKNFFTTKSEKSERFEFVSWLRGVACIIILYAHYIGVYMLSGFRGSFPQLLERKQPPPQALTAILLAAENSNINFGAFGVAIFFLITGFVTAASLHRDNHWNFLLNRVIRIWPVYIVGTALLYLTSSLYTGWAGTAMPGSIKDFAIQASLLRDWLWKPSVDGIGWTLEVQVKMYFTLFLLSRCEILNKWKSIIVLSGLGTIYVISMQPFLPQLISFNFRLYTAVYTICFSIVFIIFSFVGVIFYQMSQRHCSVQEGMVTGLACMIAFYFTAKSMVPTWITSYFAAITLFTMAYIVREMLHIGRVMKFISTISFSVYIVHGLNGYYLLNYLETIGINPYLALAITTCVSFFLAYVLYCVVERPCANFSKLIKKWCAEK